MNLDEQLDELSRMPKQPAPPYLLTRIQARLQAPTGMAPRSWRWALALGTAAVLLLNVFVFTHVKPNNEGTDNVLQLSPNHDPYHE